MRGDDKRWHCQPPSPWAVSHLVTIYQMIWFQLEAKMQQHGSNVSATRDTCCTEGHNGIKAERLHRFNTQYAYWLALPSKNPRCYVIIFHDVQPHKKVETVMLLGFTSAFVVSGSIFACHAGGPGSDVVCINKRIWHKKIKLGKRIKPVLILNIWLICSGCQHSFL